MADTLVTVDVHDLERGDLLPGHTVVVDRIEYVPAHGWLLCDHLGTVLTIRRLGARVQVWRGGLTVDDTPPHGIERTLQGVA